MKIEVDLGMLIFMLFVYILLVVVLLEQVYFEMKLTELIDYIVLTH